MQMVFLSIFTILIVKNKMLIRIRGIFCLIFNVYSFKDGELKILLAASVYTNCA